MSGSSTSGHFGEIVSGDPVNNSDPELTISASTFRDSDTGDVGFPYMDYRTEVAQMNLSGSTPILIDRTELVNQMQSRTRFIGRIQKLNRKLEEITSLNEIKQTSSIITVLTTLHENSLTQFCATVVSEKEKLCNKIETSQITYIREVYFFTDLQILTRNLRKMLTDAIGFLRHKIKARKRRSVRGIFSPPGLKFEKGEKEMFEHIIKVVSNLESLVQRRSERCLHYDSSDDESESFD
ncbi:uncharacterized protein LOC142354319 [Convolutriloba macropyga]|uniref:uncharacterized protein LOC142354319 n=1 Tax=Convolutriloba macropyga TaxID=536237 RepID=UPI003F51CA41